MNKRTAFYFLAGFVLVFGLVAACGGGDEQQQEAAQSSPPPAQSSDLAAPLIGTWELTSVDGNPLPPEIGTESTTFSDDGTFIVQVTAPNTPDESFTGEYSVLDESRIQFTYPDGMSEEQEYSLDDDTLTLLVEGVPQTYQRAS